MTDMMISPMTMMLPTFEPWSFQNADAENTTTLSFSWSDLPCQGDFLIDWKQLRSSLQEQEQVTSEPRKHAAYPAAPPSPRSLSEELLCELNHHSTDSPPKKTVRFAEVAQIRTYDVILGDHPSCRGGMALQLGWSHGGTELVQFEIYEEASRHRNMVQLHLSFFHRRERLRHLTGMSGCELLRAEYELLFEKETVSMIPSPNVLRRSSRWQ